MKIEGQIRIQELRELLDDREMTQQRGSTSEKLLVRAIQRQRGLEPCFATDKRYTCREECEWCASCQKLKAVWLL
jgi:hypothetical protein